MTAATGAPCPLCGAPTYDEGGWPPWCPECEWGLDRADAPAEGDSRWRRWRQRRTQARVLAAHRRLLGSDLSADGRYRVLGAALAVLVHLADVGLLVVAGWLWTTNAFVFVKVVLTVLLLLIAWEVRPRLRTPKLDAALTRGTAPASFAVLDQVARVTASRPADFVVVAADVNASFGRNGWRGPHVLTIGLPLWNALTDDQRLAMLGHESGHDVNGDLRSSILVGTAINALRAWSWLLQPTGRKRAIGRSSFSVFSIAELLVPLLLLPLSVVMGALAIGLFRLAARSGQRAEYQADDLAAVVAGSDAAMAMLDQLLVAERTLESMQTTLRADRQADVWTRQRDLTASIPGSQRERWRRVAARQLHRSDAGHPPTVLRVEMLRSRPRRDAALQASDLPLAAMTEELFTRRSAIERTLRDSAPD